MKINLKKLFVTAIIGGGLFVAQPAQAFYYDTSNIYNYTNDNRAYWKRELYYVITAINYISCSLVLYLWKEKRKVKILILF